MKQLNSLGINKSKIYPEIDDVADYIKKNTLMALPNGRKYSKKSIIIILIPFRKKGIVGEKILFVPYILLIYSLPLPRREKGRKKWK